MSKNGMNSLISFVILLSLTMVGEGMITVTLLWTSASIGQTPMFIGVVLFIMNIVPFLVQILFKSLRNWIEHYPVRMIIFPRIVGAAITIMAGISSINSNFSILIFVAVGLTFITFISQQCIETLMGQLTVDGILDAATSARLSQTALQSGVFVGNAVAGILIAKTSLNFVYFGIAISFLASIFLLFVVPTLSTSERQPNISRTATPVPSRDFDITLWILVGGMGLLAVQLSGFNFFVPLAFEQRSGSAAIDYGIVSAVAGIGALVATFVKLSTRNYLSYMACITVIVGNFIVIQPYGTVVTSIFSFFIGFGFNMSRIQLRQEIFQRLMTKQESALWGGRMTVAFRGVSAGVPLLFGLLLTDGSEQGKNWIFAAIGLVTMGIVVPFCLFYARKTRTMLSLS